MIIILINNDNNNNNNNINNNNNSNINNINNNLQTVLHAVYIQLKRWWPLNVAQSTNRHITLHKRTRWLTNAETRHGNADSPSSQRWRHKNPETLPAQDITVSKNITSHQLDLSRPTPLMNATLIRATHTRDADYPSCQVHITSIPAHQPTCCYGRWWGEWPC